MLVINFMELQSSSREQIVMQLQLREAKAKSELTRQGRLPDEREIHWIGVLNLHRYWC